MPSVDRSILLCWVFKSLFIVTAAVFSYARIDFWFHPIYVFSFVFIIFSVFVFSFCQLFTSCIFKLLQKILRKYLTRQLDCFFGISWFVNTFLCVSFVRVLKTNKLIN